MSWMQVKILTTQKYAESLAEGLEHLGAQAVTFEDAQDQPIFEPELNTTPLWQETLVSGLFSAEQSPESIKSALKSTRPGIEDSQIRLEILEDKDWVREWQQYFEPILLGKIWIVPSWKAAPEPDGLNLYLDPGLAFGTGSHPTTAMCLQALSALDLKGKRVIDFGCGSGILAIAAKKLGAKEVIGIDIDPQAIAASQANAEKNGETLQWILGPKLPTDLGSADVLVANILAEPLRHLAPQLQSLCHGALIMSGVLAKQAAEVIAAYERPLVVQNQVEDWVLIASQ